jgi:hypothetical protein
MGTIRSGIADWLAPQGQPQALKTGVRPAPDNSTRDIRKANIALLPLLCLGLAAAVCFGWKTNSVCAVLMWAVACLAVGGLTGFLFGIPRAGAIRAKTPEGGNDAAGKPSPAAAAESGSRPNTNLEEVSDWLTKILVGLTLVNLGELQVRVQAIATNMASSIRAKPTDVEVSYATALVVAFSVIGFLCSYLYTRLFLQGAIRRSDDDLTRFNEVAAEEMTRALVQGERVVKPGEPSVPSPAERSAAERVAKAVPADRPEVALVPLRVLASEYVRVRDEMPVGDERTRRMADIAGRMRPFALAAAPYLQELANSSSAGERLAAVSIVQMNFDPAYIGWLADRLWLESAFIGYQAASILLVRMSAGTESERTKILAAVEAARLKLPYPEEQRDKLIDSILGKGRPPAPLPPPRGAGP